MRKKLLIVTQWMKMGGIEKALLAMLENIPKEKYEITVKLMTSEGELYNEIPQYIKIRNIFGNEKTVAKRMWNYIKKGDITTAFKTGLYTKLIQHANHYKQNKYYSRMAPKDNTVYDLAIAYHSPLNFPTIYVMNNIKSKKKVLWIHCDASYYEKSLRKIGERFYAKFDKIFCVSDFSVRKFVEIFPILEEKTCTFNNVVVEKKMAILSQESEGFSDKYDGTRILTVGRLSEEKGQDIIPSVMSKLVSEGFNIRWYLIGDGSTKMQLEDKIREYHLENNIILLGTKENPYPFIKDCDIYIQPSRHEAFSITVAEARAFNKPIITTNTGASEQIIHGETGLIVDFQKEQFYNAIRQLLDNKQLQLKLINGLSKQIVDTSKEMEKLYEVIESIH
ncbi:glycosyltransferase [Oceanobacillus piezotolerans]|nr:glycosyltransferase [Oceanobacillus piezotolerans]